MRASFNVLDAPWIPVVRLDGGRELLGIRQALRRAPELREISAVSALEEYSVYRFLSVMLMDALRPKRVSSIKKLLKQGQFDMDEIEGYFSLCESEGVSFDLFDEQRPFMQAGYLKDGDNELKTVGRLDYAQPCGNNHSHFEHKSAELYELPIADVFPKLLAINIFAINGGSGYQPSISSSQGKNPYMMLINGANLFETLCFMLLPASEHDYDESRSAEWMSIPEIKKDQVPDTSYFRMMLYPVRSVLLVPDEGQDSIRSIYYSIGYPLPPKGVWRDPNAAYCLKKVKTDDSNAERWYAVVPKEDVAPWRNYAEIIRSTGRPEVLERYVKYDRGWQNVSITLYGLVNDNATCLNTVRCSLRIQRRLLESEYRENIVFACIKAVDSIEAVLKRALRVGLRNEKADAKDKKKENDQIKEAASSYYDKCELLFWKLLDDMDRTEDDGLELLMKNWKDQAFAVAKQEYDRTVKSVRLRGKGLRQVILGEDILHNWNAPPKGRKRK